MKTMLINETDNDKNIIDDMILVFCATIKYLFKILLENNIKINELEKIVVKKHNLNIRQSKETVKSAKQTILSQKELHKMNYEDYCIKNIKEKVGENPDLWLVNKKKVLGIVS